MRYTHALAMLLALAAPLGAQTWTGESAIDSAAVARAAWGRATKLAATDPSAALREATHAAAAWPMQPAYVWGRAVLAARAADTADVRDALEQLADLGLGRDVRSDARFAAFVRRPDFAPVLARLDANRAPLDRGHAIATLADSTFWPEGVDYDPRTRRYYVASIAHGTIAEVADGRIRRELRRRDDPALGAVMGVRVDARRGMLWATLAPRPGDADTTIAALVRLRLTDGTIERRWDLPPVAGGHVLGDLAVGPSGDVWMTDSKDAALYRLRSGADTLERIVHPLLRSPQGMAPTPDGRVVYVADYSHGLLRVDTNTGAITRVADAPHSTALGCDGIAWDRGAIIAVQNGVAPPRIMRFVLDASGTTVTRAERLDQRAPSAGEPTIGVVVDRTFVYVANSPWDAVDDSGHLRANARVARPVLVAVPLPR